MRFQSVLATTALVATGVVMSPALATSHKELAEDTTFDGLVEVKKSSFQRAWIDPTIDFSRYTKVMP